jgi:hypothetical protein
MKHHQFAFVLLLAPACAGTSTATTASDITSAVPKPEWIDIQTASTTPLVVDSAPSPQPPATCSGGPPAMFAAMSVQVMTGANSPLDGVLGIVGAITQSPPAVMTPDHAVWGPLSGPNDPLVHQLDIARVAPDTYHFVLLAQLAGGSNASWTGLFQGDIHMVDAQHAEGDVTIDFDAIHSLDATSQPATGAIAIHFASAPDGRQIEETFGGVNGNDAHYVFAQDANGVAFDFATSTDFDHNGTANEVLDVRARYAPDGSGKASTIVSGGDLGSAQVGAIECWDNQQRVLFYADDINANPPAGDPGCCVM